MYLWLLSALIGNRNQFATGEVVNIAEDAVLKLFSNKRRRFESLNVRPDGSLVPTMASYQPLLCAATIESKVCELDSLVHIASILAAKVKLLDSLGLVWIFGLQCSLEAFVGSVS